MTICASVKARDGLVLATDSMTTIQLRTASGQLQVVQTYAHARKVFQIGQLPMGVMTYGAGNIGNRSIEGVVLDLAIPKTVRNAKTVATRLYGHVRMAYDAEFGGVPQAQRPTLGMYVGGYSSPTSFAEEWEFLLPRDPAPRAVRAGTAFGASWRGIDIPFTRLLMGYDPRLVPHVVATGMSDAQARAILAQFQTVMVYDGMPMQDAVDFAAFILRTTIGMARFEIGTDACGGPLQVAAILPESGFQWIARPELRLQEPML